jgi:hypothetical protein
MGPANFAASLVICHLPGIIGWLRGHSFSRVIWVALVILDIYVITSDVSPTLFAMVLWFVCLIWSITGNTRVKQDT